MKQKVIKILSIIILFNYIFMQITPIALATDDTDSAGFYMSEEEFNEANDDGTTKGPDGNKYNNPFFI